MVISIEIRSDLAGLIAGVAKNIQLNNTDLFFLGLFKNHPELLKLCNFDYLRGWIFLDRTEQKLFDYLVINHKLSEESFIEQLFLIDNEEKTL